MKTCLVIVGPTAVGKTAFAIEVAKTFNTQIISADSRQCYRELNIGVGKPSPAQLDEVKHYFINSHSIEQEVHAALFEQYALNAADEIFINNNIAVIAGGTGLYVDAFCNGMDEVPIVLPEIRKQIIQAYNNKGLEWLQQQVKEHDPEYYNNGEIQNPHRLMRTLEVVLSTGRSIRSYHSQQRKKRDFSIVKIGLELPKTILHDRINRRVDEMVADGLEDEAKRLIPFKHLNALNTVGYKELFACFEGRSSFNEAVEMIKKNTRQYAKRQLTWFKKDESTHWLHPENLAVIPELLQL